MLIAIPTYRRHSNGEAQTVRHLPASIPGHQVCLIVREVEVQPYKKLLKEHNRDWPVVPIQGECSGISDTRNFILDYARRKKVQKVCMVDDDLHFICRSLPNDDVHLRPCTDAETVGMFDWLEASLDKYAHASVSMREGNNRVPGKMAAVEATRGIRVVAYNLAAIGKTRFRSEVEGREDLDMTLQLLRQGLPNIVTYHWAQGQKSAQAPGGLSDDRTLAKIHESAEKLKKLHPEFVKIRTKSNKSGGLAGERTEVTIYWKAALKQKSGTLF